MKSLFISTACRECGHQMPADPFVARCPQCASPWLYARYDCAGLSSWPAALADRPTTLWRYAELLPFPDSFQAISMGEGWTPLTRAEGLESETGHAGIWIKDERQQPTGSFKDRQAAVAVSALKTRGIEQVVLASTGNAAAAYAAYCARARIRLWVFLANSVPIEKVRELALYGAEVVKIAGTYDQAKRLAADFAARRGLHLDEGAKAIPGQESMKTIAFEIAEQLSRQVRPPAGGTAWQAPDWYIQAVSGGIGPLGVLKGFIELHQAGLVDRVPKLGLVQTEGCAPMVRAWEQKAERAMPVQPDSLITVLATGDPGFAYVMLKQGIDRYGGAMTSVSDGDAFRAMRRVARLEGFSMEPAASVAFAGLDRLVAEGVIRPGERIVVNCSGHTFSAEKHALEDQYAFNLEMELASANQRPADAISVALERLDEESTTIVVIDDNPYDNHLMRRLLQSYKRYRVLEAFTGQDGIDLVRQRRPALVLLDLSLPDMDGLAVLTAIKNDPRTSHIPVMVVSARSMDAEEQENLQQATDSVWQKGDFSARDLISHVAQILGNDAPELHVRAGPMAQFGSGRRARILLVEDNVWEARLMRRLLESRQRFDVTVAHSGADALAIAKGLSPDLVLLDLKLPDISGEQVAEQLQIINPHCPVVVVTGKDLSPDQGRRLAEQTSSVWIKGNLDRSSFLAHVETLLPE